MSDNKDCTNIKFIIGALLYEIDASLLMEEDEKTDKDKIYTKDEIRTALKNGGNKLYNVLIKCNIDVLGELNYLN